MAENFSVQTSQNPLPSLPGLGESQELETATQTDSSIWVPHETQMSEVLTNVETSPQQPPVASDETVTAPIQTNPHNESQTQLPDDASQTQVVSPAPPQNVRPVPVPAPKRRRIVAKKQRRFPHFRRVLCDNLQGISKACIRKLARWGGVKRISKGIYEETRGVLKVFLENIIKDATTYTAYAQRKTVTATDIILSLKKNGRTLYGFD